MRLAVILGIAPDRRSGKTLSDVMPADEAIKTVKEWVEKGECPDPSFPRVEVWSAGQIIKSHNFKLRPVSSVESAQSGDQGDASGSGDQSGDQGDASDSGDQSGESPARAKKAKGS